MGNPGLFGGAQPQYGAGGFGAQQPALGTFGAQPAVGFGQQQFGGAGLQPQYGAGQFGAPAAQNTLQGGFQMPAQNQFTTTPFNMNTLSTQSQAAVPVNIGASTQPMRLSAPATSPLQTPAATIAEP